MEQTNIAIVSYQNTIPFLYGLQHSEITLNARLLISPPFKCAENLRDSKANIALIPAIKLLDIPDIHIFSDYCIGASREVNTVALFANCPKEEIDTIYLDSDSRTSVELLKILAKEYWKISPKWATLDSVDTLKDGEGALLIGDKVFEHESKFSCKYDLAKEWFEYTGSHFVFAIWVARNNTPESIKQRVNLALKYGVDNVDSAINELGNFDKKRLSHYLKNNIEFQLTQEKLDGLKLFISKVKEPSSEIF